MSTAIDDSEIHQIVQRVVQNVMGSSERAPAQPAARKIVAIGADHGGFELKETLKSEVSTLGFEVMDVGTVSKEAVDYPDFAHAVAQSGAPRLVLPDHRLWLHLAEQRRPEQRKYQFAGSSRVRPCVGPHRA